MCLTVPGLTNPDVNLKKMHQLYNDVFIMTQCYINANLVPIGQLVHGDIRIHAMMMASTTKSIRPSPLQWGTK